MAYYFFEKWMSLSHDFESFAAHINAAHDEHKAKVHEWKVIQDSLETAKTPIREARDLLTLYRSCPAPYTALIADIIKAQEHVPLSRSEIRSFIDVLDELSHVHAEEHALGQQLLSEIIEGHKPEHSQLYKLKELLETETLFLRTEDQRFAVVRDTFFAKVAPGAGVAHYDPLLTLITTHTLTHHGNQLYHNNIPIQGVTLSDNTIIIRGDHYAPEQNAKWIAGDAYVKPGMSDPCSYFVERGKMASWSQQRIQKAMGAVSAQAVVSLEIAVYPEQVWLSIAKDRPIKFAIEQLRPNQVTRVIQAARLVG